MAENGNGKAAEWLWRLATAVIAAILAYSALAARVSVLDERQRNNFDEILRRLERIERRLP